MSVRRLLIRCLIPGTVALALVGVVFAVTAEEPPVRAGPNGSPPPPDPAQPRGVAAPKIVAADLKPDAPKTQVLIYYANETRADASYQRIVGWFTGSKDARVQNLGKRLQEDAKQFPETVTAEVEALRGAASKSDKPFALVVFTNALAAEGKFQYLAPSAGEGKLQTGALKLPKFTSPALVAHPLSSPHTFAAALLAVNKQFPAEKHSYLLVSKSHGSHDTLVTPMVIRSYGVADKDRVLKAVIADYTRRDRWRKAVATLGKNKDETPTLGGDKVDNPILDGDKMDNPTLSAETVFFDASAGLDKDNLLQAWLPWHNAVPLGTTAGPVDPATLSLLDYTGPEFFREAALVIRYVQPPTVRNHVGIAKPVLLSILREAGTRHGMSFPVVFLESCKSEVPPAMLDWLKEQPNVGLLYASDIHGLSYKSLDYTKALSGKGTAGEKLNAALKAKYEADKKAKR